MTQDSKIETVQLVLRVYHLHRTVLRASQEPQVRILSVSWQSLLVGKDSPVVLWSFPSRSAVLRAKTVEHPLTLVRSSTAIRIPSGSKVRYVLVGHGFQLLPGPTGVESAVAHPFFRQDSSKDITHDALGYHSVFESQSIRNLLGKEPSNIAKSTALAVDAVVLRCRHISALVNMQELSQEVSS